MTSPAAPARARHPRSARVRVRADFGRVFEEGRRAALPALALHWLPAPAPRLGLAVSRKVDVRPLLSGQYPLADAVDAFRAAADKNRSTKVQLVA